MDSRSGLMLEGLFRIVEHNETYDCAMISGYITEEARNISRREQRKRHAKLLAKLKLRKSFFVISLKGGWRNEYGKVGKEESFFIVNKGTFNKQGKEMIRNLEEFGRIIADLGTEYEQDSVLIVPRGALSGKSRAYLIYMESLYEKRYVGRARLGRITGDIFSRVGGRPFVFDEGYDSVEILNVHYPASGMLGYMGYRNFSRKEWRDVPVSVLNGKSLEEWLKDRDGSVFLRYIRG